MARRSHRADVIVANDLVPTGLPGSHGEHGSGAFHHELGQLIDNSNNLGELQRSPR